jgi:uncharacterized protein
MSTQWVVFAKAPVPGSAKTRLIPALGAEGAATLAARLLDHALAQCRAAACDGDGLELCVTPNTSHPAFRAAAERGDLRLTLQHGGDLGERMHGAFHRVLATAPRAVLIGTDAPGLVPSVLRAASAALNTADAVFVPALDGGYALVGLRQPQPALFTDMPWSTASVMAATRDRARAAGLRWVELPPVADIDEPSDLVHLPADWRPIGGRLVADRRTSIADPVSPGDSPTG